MGGKLRKHEPAVPAAPFSRWLDQQVIEREQQYKEGAEADALSPVEQVLSTIGWGTNEAAVRKFYRYRHQVVDRTAGSKATRWTETAQVWPRRVVEDALDRVSPGLFYELYPEYANERDITLEPDAWCPFCKELVTPIDGLCPFCVCAHGHLFREVGVTDDGFACLACLAEERRQAQREYNKRKRAA